LEGTTRNRGQALPRSRSRTAKQRSDLGFLSSLFDVHVFEFTGFEDLPALFTLDEFRIFVPAHNLHARVLAGLFHITAWKRGRL
jgi:hypothetical protein